MPQHSLRKASAWLAEYITCGQDAVSWVLIPFPDLQLGCQPAVTGGAQLLADNKQYFPIFNGW